LVITSKTFLRETRNWQKKMCESSFKGSTLIACFVPQTILLFFANCEFFSKLFFPQTQDDSVLTLRRIMFAKKRNSYKMPVLIIGKKNRFSLCCKVLNWKVVTKAKKKNFFSQSYWLTQISVCRKKRLFVASLVYN